MLATLAAVAGGNPVHQPHGPAEVLLFGRDSGALLILEPLIKAQGPSRTCNESKEEEEEEGTPKPQTPIPKPQTRSWRGSRCTVRRRRPRSTYTPNIPPGGLRVDRPGFRVQGSGCKVLPAPTVSPKPSLRAGVVTVYA